MVLFEEPLSRIASETEHLYRSLKRDLEVSFGWQIDFIPTIILFNDHDRFQRTVDSDLIVAYAVPDKNLMVIDYSRMMTAPFTLEATLKHELCHLLLHHHIRNENLPKWFDEGIAQWVSGGLADILLNQRQSELDKAIRRGRYLSFRSISERFPIDQPSFMLAYEQSRSMVEYMIHEYGQDDFLQVLGHLEKGYYIEEAVQRVWAISFERLEGQWYNELHNRATWLLYLANNIYEALFFVAAMALIFGFIRALIKKRARAQYEEDNNI